MEDVNSNEFIDTTVNRADFEGYGYSERKIKANMKSLENAKKKAAAEAKDRNSSYASVESIGDSKMLEEDVAYYIDPEEYALLGKNATIEHAHEFDDWCRHNDFVCTIDLGDKKIPFFIDVTCNTRKDKIEEKFGYGRGHFWFEGMPGLGRCDYFKNEGLNLDKNGDPTPDKTSAISIAPRFIVGYDPNMDWGFEEADQGMACNRYTILAELSEQAKLMLGMYETKYDDTEPPKALKTIWDNLKLIDQQFDKALEDFDEYLDVESENYESRELGRYGKSSQQPKGQYKKDVKAAARNLKINEVYNVISNQADIEYKYSNAAKKQV